MKSKYDPVHVGDCVITKSKTHGIIVSEYVWFGEPEYDMLRIQPYTYHKEIVTHNRIFNTYPRPCCVQLVIFDEL